MLFSASESLGVGDDAFLPFDFDDDSSCFELTRASNGSAEPDNGSPFSTSDDSFVVSAKMLVERLCK